MRPFHSLVLASLLTATALVPAFAETPSPARITVTGEGVVEGVPDIAVLSLGVTTTGDTAVAAMADNTAALNAVIARLIAAGVAERDMQTSNLTINPNWSSYASSSKQQIDGYTASNQLTLTVRALESLGTVLDAAITDGANTLNGLSFGLSNPRPPMDAARAEAMADARTKATLLVEAAGVKLGRIVSITEGSIYSQPVPMFRMEADAVASPVPVAAGELATSASVSVVYEIDQ